MVVKFFGYFSEFHNKDTVRIDVPPKIFSECLNFDGVKTYVVPVGTVWKVERVDFPNKKIVGSCLSHIKGYAPFPVRHEFDFEEIDINLNRSVTFADEDATLSDQTTALLRSVLDNLFTYSQAREEITTAILQTYYKHAHKLKSFAPWFVQD